MHYYLYYAWLFVTMYYYCVLLYYYALLCVPVIQSPRAGKTA
jgi:hypothetical protein